MFKDPGYPDMKPSIGTIGGVEDDNGESGNKGTISPPPPKKNWKFYWQFSWGKIKWRVSDGWPEI